MEKFNGTVGPWVVSESKETLKNGVVMLQIDAPAASCENIIQVVHDELFNQGEANANLVATAPELLDFAIEIVNTLSEDALMHAKGKLLINKALGK